MCGYVHGNVVLEERRQLKKVLLQGGWFQGYLEFGEIESLAFSVRERRLIKSSKGVRRVSFFDT